MNVPRLLVTSRFLHAPKEADLWQLFQPPDVEMRTSGFLETIEMEENLAEILVLCILRFATITSFCYL